MKHIKCFDKPKESKWASKSKKHQDLPSFPKSSISTLIESCFPPLRPRLRIPFKKMKNMILPSLQRFNFIVERFYCCQLPLKVIILVQFSFARICVILLMSPQYQLALQKEFQFLTRLLVLIFILKAEMLLEKPKEEEGIQLRHCSQLSPLNTQAQIAFL